MTLNEAKEQILKRSKELLEKDAEGKRLVCPICKSGNDEDEKGLLSNDGIHFTCPLGCFADKDIVEIIGIKVGTNNEENMIRAAASELQISLDDEDEEEEQEEEKETSKKRLKKENDDIVDYTLFYNDCLEKVSQCNYLQDKSISKDVQKRFSIGFASEWIHPNTSEDMRKYIAATPRLIIPFTIDSYAAIYTGNNKNVAAVQRVGEDTLFNVDELYNGIEPLFVYEDEIDALSTIECGYDAVSIGGISHLDNFYNKLREKHCNRLLVFCLDESTEDGQEIALDLKTKLSEINQDYIVYNVVKKYNNANEYLLANKTNFIKSITAGLDKAKEHQLEKVKVYQELNSNIKYLSGFINNISKDVDTPVITTGFKELDTVFDGGLYEGLYCICSEYSIGKTTLALQLCDNIAKNNCEVLYFSLETSRNELIAKSLSRLTADASIKTKGQLSEAKSVRDITVKEVYDKYDDGEKKIIASAVNSYKKYANNIFMFECDDVDELHIRETIEEHITQTSKAGRKIVVFIDSIDSLSNYEELKRISRDNKITIIGLSCKEIDDIIKNNSFDVILELTSVPYYSQLDKTISLMKKNPRTVELTLLKNKTGKVGDVLQFIYFANYNLFLCKGIKDKKTEEKVKEEKNIDKEVKIEETVDDNVTEDETKEELIDDNSEEEASTEDDIVKDESETDHILKSDEDDENNDIVEENDSTQEQEEKQEVEEKPNTEKVVPPYSKLNLNNSKHSSKKKRKHR